MRHVVCKRMIYKACIFGSNKIERNGSITNKLMRVTLLINWPKAICHSHWVFTYFSKRKWCSNTDTKDGFSLMVPLVLMQRRYEISLPRNCTSQSYEYVISLILYCIFLIEFLEHAVSTTQGNGLLQIPKWYRHCICPHKQNWSSRFGTLNKGIEFLNEGTTTKLLPQYIHNWLYPRGD